MPGRVVWGYALSLAVLLGFGCSFDDRDLQIKMATSGGSSTDGGSATRGGSVSTSAGSSAAGSATQGGDTGLAAGEACTANADCASGPCLDGICCATACDGVCLSCAAKITGKADGACESVQAGTDPHDDCKPASDTCGLDGQCDGAGACRFALPSTPCGAESCAKDQYTPPSTCNGSGKCVTPAAVSCGGHPCTGTRCNIPCKLSVDCPNGLYCAGGSCAPQKTNGAQCATNDECANAHCVADGVCCDKPCDSTCYACLQSATGVTDGTCAAVKNGVTHGKDCPGAAKCGSSTSVTPAPTCNGAGACATGAPTSCGTYQCNPTLASCLTSCNADVDCATTAYCSSRVCKAKAAPGTLCTADVQCQSNDCNGRCCKTGTPCTCPQPSAGNLIKNPGFDKDLSSWTIDSGAATINWQPGTFLTGNGSYADGNACPYSGSAYISEPDTNNSQKIWQCVPIALNTNYNFGVQIATLSGAYAHCTLDLYQGPGCTGTVNNVTDFEWLNVGWSLGSATAFASSFYVSAKVACYVESGGSFFFDDIYITPAPGQY